MQLKPITVIAVLLLVVASLLVSGCIDTTPSFPMVTPTPTASATPSTATHDALLEKYLAENKNISYADSGEHIRAYELEWINSTTAHLLRSYQNTSTDETWSYDDTYVVFPTSQDATNYLNAINKTAYRLASTQYPSEGAYLTATGHAPQIYKQYVWNEGNPFNISEYTGHAITQLDNIIATDTFKRVG